MIANVQPTQIASTTTPDALQHRKLTDAAQQFEGMFLQQMLKPMSNMSKEDASATDDGDDQVGDTSTYQSLGVESLARAISAAGGLGIARNIVASVEKESHGKLEAKKNLKQH